MSTPNETNPSPADSTAPNVAVPAAATDVTPPKGNLSLKPLAPATAPAASTDPVTAAAAPAAPTVATPIAAPAAPKPKLNLNVAPRSTASDLNNASTQKVAERKYTPVAARDDDQPSAAITVIAGLAAAAAITFAVLLFLKTK
jgi:hypothetical protein